MKMGSAFVNKDGSINIYLDALPFQNKLQIRDWDEEPRRSFDNHNAPQALPLPTIPVIDQSANETPF
jgi:hypothetical protein